MMMLPCRTPTRDTNYSHGERINHDPDSRAQPANPPTAEGRNVANGGGQEIQLVARHIRRFCVPPQAALRPRKAVGRRPPDMLPGRPFSLSDVKRIQGSPAREDQEFARVGRLLFSYHLGHRGRGITTALPLIPPWAACCKCICYRRRGYWAIETKQHYRRDHTQREDHCLVRNPIAARNLSPMRSARLFLHSE